MSKPPTSARGRRTAVAPPPPPPPRRASWGRAERGALGRSSADLPPRFPPLGGLGWRAISVFVLAIFGLGDSIYLTLTHYTELVPLVCKSVGPIDCVKVTTSPQSVIFGIPVAVYGLAFYGAMVALCLPWTWRRQTPLVAGVRLAAATVGLGFVAYLLYTELYVIHAICLWCTAVHVATFLVFVLLVTGWDELAELGRSDRAAPPLTERDFDLVGMDEED